jgi:hypothetical protein
MTCTTQTAMTQRLSAHELAEQLGSAKGVQTLLERGHTHPVSDLQGGVILSQSVAPGWIWLSGFVGAGLTFAGITGTCGMARLLAAMPWNRVSL